VKSVGGMEVNFGVCFGGMDLFGLLDSFVYKEKDQRFDREYDICFFFFNKSNL
jgi:hypothetical protein